MQEEQPKQEEQPLIEDVEHAHPETKLIEDVEHAHPDETETDLVPSEEKRNSDEQS